MPIKGVFSYSREKARELRDSGMVYTEIGKVLGVAPQTIYAGLNTRATNGKSVFKDPVEMQRRLAQWRGTG